MPAALPADPPSRPAGRPMTGWHALVWFLGFFGAMFIVNGIFLWNAITTFPGEDVEKSYLSGLDYNREIARRAHQADAGWQAETGIVFNETGAELRARLMTRDGAPLPVIVATAVLRHPADRAFDRIVALAPIGGGEYAARLEHLSSGLWTIRLSAQLDPERDGHDFVSVRQVFVP